MIDVARGIHSQLSKSNFLTVLVRGWRRIVGQLKYFVISSLIRLVKPRITLTYQNQAKPDGIGAQLQRILAIRSLAKNLNLSYMHTPIASIAIHPLDPYQSEEEMKLFLERLNTEFKMADTQEVAGIDDIEVETVTLSFQDLLKATLASFVSHKKILISCSEPYRVSEFDPKMLVGISSLVPNFSRVYRSGLNIAVHIRWGVGGMTVQKGEKISRQIEIGYYFDLLERILIKVKSNPVNVTIFTDAPAEDLEFNLPASQIDLWNNSESVDRGTMSVRGLDLKSTFSKLGIEPRIVRGGDPLLALQEMASSDILIMSRSSFSYVAGLLNVSRSVYYPSSFWHKPLPQWLVMKGQ